MRLHISVQQGSDSHKSAIWHLTRLAIAENIRIMHSKSTRHGKRCINAHAGVPPVSMTCTGDGLDHRVGDASLSDDCRSGRYRAVCGRLVIPAALVAPSGPPCLACAGVLGEGRRRRERGTSPEVLRRLVQVFVRFATAWRRSSRRSGPAVAQQTGVES